MLLFRPVVPPTKQQQIADEANAKRSETQKGVPKAEAGERGSTICATRLGHEKGQIAKAEAASVGRGTVARGDALVAARPGFAEKPGAGPKGPRTFSEPGKTASRLQGNRLCS